MLKVYMVGLIYFNGCDDPENMMAFAPNGTTGAFGITPHFASLWIKEDFVNLSATQWSERQSHVIDGETTIEFKLPGPAEIVFPDQGNAVSCAALDALMPKLKKEKKEDEDLEFFEVEPNGALAIARVKIRGGTLVPYEMKRNKKFGLVEWRIDNPSGLDITAGARKIALQPGVDAEVVFSNIHEIDLNAQHDDLADGNHIQLFKQLNATLCNDPNVTLEAAKTGNPPEPATNNGFLKRLEGLHFTCGETPPCCARIVVDTSGT